MPTATTRDQAFRDLASSLLSDTKTLTYIVETPTVDQDTGIALPGTATAVEVKGLLEPFRVGLVDETTIKQGDVQAWIAAKDLDALNIVPSGRGTHKIRLGTAATDRIGRVVNVDQITSGGEMFALYRLHLRF